MAEALKMFFNERVVRSIGHDVRQVYAKFPEQRFVADGLRGLEPLSLTERGAHLAECLHRHLPADFETATQILIDSLGPELESSELFGFEPFRYLPHVTFVSRYGLGHFEMSMRAQLALTKRFSAEFSIRSFIEREPERTYAQLRTWATDPNVHVRRLVSEGMRPRLPWAPRLRALQKDPTPVLSLLELLKDDPERYVQRSVANNLNDIGKDHPALVVEVCQRWSEGASPGRTWIVKHALRSLVKGGDRAALTILGVAKTPKVAVRNVQVMPRRVRVGQALAITFELASTGRSSQDLLVDYIVHFVKANGAQKPKVFKLRRLTLPSAGSQRLEARLSFAPMTTRKHYPGTHRVALRVNGLDLPLCEFELRA